MPSACRLRATTPFTDATLGAGTSAAVANGFGPNSPYNADLPYNLKQIALFGEVSYDFTNQLTGTAGLRYYDYKEERTFKSGGLFANGDNQFDKTKSDGYSPRFLLAYKMSPNVTWNAQASKGFRLGGVNDPLNIPLCTDQDRAIFGGYQRFRTNRCGTTRSASRCGQPGLRLNAAVFHTQMKDLQVTLDAGSCSSRVVFNVPKAHSTGIELEMTCEAERQPGAGFCGLRGECGVRFDRPGRQRECARRHSRGQPPALRAEGAIHRQRHLLLPPGRTRVLRHRLVAIRG